MCELGNDDAKWKEKIRELKKDNNLVEALTNLEKLITIKSERFGKKSEEVKFF